MDNRKLCVVDEKQLQMSSFRTNEVRKLGKDILKISSEDAFKHVYDTLQTIYTRNNKKNTHSR